MNSTSHKLDKEDFADIVDAAQEELPKKCLQWIDEFELSYRVLGQEDIERTVLEVLKRIDSGQFPVSGESRKSDWEVGWQENLDNFKRCQYDLDQLIPKFIRSQPILRFRQRYVETLNPRFEWQFFQIYRYWLFHRFFQEVDSIYEFGCGPGYNFVALQDLYPHKKLYGLDWAASAVDTVNTLAESHRMNVKGYEFDFFHPNESFSLEPNSAVLTICGLEQTGTNYSSFLDYLLLQKPKICLHIEPWYEQYNPDNLIDYLAMRYHKARGYLEGFYPRLQQLEKEGRIRILSAKRSFFGSLFHEGYSYISWVPLGRNSE